MAARPRMAAAHSPARTPTKVDRSAAYAARYLAKNVVAAGLADRCTIQLAYAIGVADPLSVYVDTHGTGKVDEAKLEQVLPQLMNLKPRGIREHLSLNKPIYARTSAYGHFGREPDADGGFSWEKTDLADAHQARRLTDAASAVADNSTAGARDQSSPRIRRHLRETLLPQLALRLRRERRSAFVFFALLSTTFGSKSASAPASICSGRRNTIRMSG